MSRVAHAAAFHLTRLRKAPTDGREIACEAVKFEPDDGFRGEVACCTDDDTARAAEKIDGVDGVPELLVDG